MTDVFTPSKRSAVMARIRGRGNKDTELALIRLFRSNHITGWRRHKPIFGKPDFVFPSVRLAVFVDGCFWHGCPSHSTMPKNNAEFWQKKLAGNKARDLIVNKTLRAKGWRILRIWEHELSRKYEARLLRRIHGLLSQTLRPNEDSCTATTSVRAQTMQKKREVEQPQ